MASELPPVDSAQRSKAPGFIPRNAGLLLAALFLLGSWAWLMVELFQRRPPDVGYGATPPEVVAAMVEMAGLKDGDTVYDLGCGDGRLAIAAALRNPTVRGVGIDIDPDRVAVARDAAAAAGLTGRLRFRRADIFREDLSRANVVMMYLSTSVNERLRPQFDKLPPGSRIVSYAYSIPGVKPVQEKTVRGKDGVEHRMLLWVTPLKKDASP